MDMSLDHTGRFLAVNRCIARAEATNGLMVPRDVCSRLGAPPVLGNRRASLASMVGGDESTDAVRPATCGRPTKRPRIEPAIIWAGSTMQHQSESSAGLRSLFCGAGDGVVALSLPFSRPSSSALLDCRRMTYTSSRDHRPILPFTGKDEICEVATAHKRRNSKPLPQRRVTKSDKQRSERRLEQHQVYQQRQWEELNIDGVVEIASGGVDGVVVRSSSQVDKQAISDLQRRLQGKQDLRSGSKPIVGVLHEPNAELLVNISTLNNMATSSVVDKPSAIRSTISLRQPRDVARNTKNRRLPITAPSSLQTTSAAQAMATSASAGCFSTLLPLYDRNRLWVHRTPKTDVEATLLHSALQTLARPYALGKHDNKRNRLAKRINAKQRSVESSFQLFFASHRALGVHKTQQPKIVGNRPSTTYNDCRSATSLRTRVRAAAAQYSFELHQIGTCDEHDEDLNYAEAVAAYNQLMASGRTRTELLVRMRALRADSDAIRGPSMEGDTSFAAHVQAAAVNPRGGSPHSTLSREQTPAKEVLLPFLDEATQSRDIVLANGSRISFTLGLDEGGTAGYAASICPGQKISGFLVEEWTNALVTMREFMDSSSESPAEGTLKQPSVKVLSYLSSQWHAKRRLAAQPTEAEPPAPVRLPDRVLSLQDVFNVSIDSRGEGLWQPVNVGDNHWIVVSFFANFNKAMTKCKPSLEVYDTLGARTSDAATLQAIQAVEQMIRATLTPTSSVAAMLTPTRASKSDADNTMTAATQKILQEPWRIRFYPEASMQDANDCGLICMQRLTLALLPQVPAETVAAFVNRKSIEYVLLSTFRNDEPQFHAAPDLARRQRLWEVMLS